MWHWPILIMLSIIIWGHMPAATTADQQTPQLSAVEEKKRELNHLKRQLRNSKRQLRQQQHEEQTLLERLDAISRRQAVLTQEVQTAAQELKQAQKQAMSLQAAHHRLSDQLDQQRQQLQQRVRQLYKLGQLPYVTLLLSVQDIAEFSRKIQYIHHLATHDRQQIEAYHASRNQLIKAQSELALATQNLQTTQVKLNIRQEALARERQHQASLLRSVREDKELAQRMADELAQATTALVALIDRLQEQAKRSQNRPIAVKGQLSWPLDGTILSPYGRVRHPTLDVVTFQQGIYIDAVFGQEIRAAADGKVVFADLFKGLDRLLLVDHGNHIMTLYGHTSSILVQVGDIVRGGQVVAKAGDSSTLGKPALYFAVRHKTAPQDPLQWLRQRSVRLTERPGARAGEFQ